MDSHGPFHDEPEVHAEDEGWIVSYADMMTLLFGFFAMLFTYATFDDDSYIRMRKELARFFGGTYVQTAGGVDSTIEDAAPPKDKIPLLATADLKQTEDGLDVGMVSGLTFKSGGTELTEDAKQSLRAMVEVIQDLSVPTQAQPQIRIEGHTDDIPLSGKGLFKSNWELSAARAGAIASYLESLGVPNQSLAAMGYGSSRPAYPTRDPAGKRITENLERNRRVVLKVVFPKAKDR